MRLWPFRRRRVAEPSEDAQAAVSQADRAMLDAERLDCRAGEVAEKFTRSREQNHYVTAVVRAIRGV